MTYRPWNDRAVLNCIISALRFRAAVRLLVYGQDTGGWSATYAAVAEELERGTLELVRREAGRG